MCPANRYIRKSPERSKRPKKRHAKQAALTKLKKDTQTNPHAKNKKASLENPHGKSRMAAKKPAAKKKRRRLGSRK